MYHPAGVYPAMPTPFMRNGDLDETGLRDLVSYFNNTGVNGLLVLGTIGEFAMMSGQERRRAAEIIVGAADKLEIIANAGCPSTRETIRMALFLKDIGVDAVIAVEPYFYHPTAKGMARHYLDIAEKADMPVMAYNIPQFSGNRLTPDIMDAFAGDGRIVGLKDSEGDPVKLMEFIRRAPEGFSVMVGADPLVSYGICMGAKGMLIGSASVAPRACVEMYRAAIDGDMDKTFAMQGRLNDIIRAMSVGTFPAAVKYMLSGQGLPGGHVRPPLEGLSDAEKLIVDDYMKGAKAMSEVVV
ncbi:dihydrodipicolinate synthase [Methanocella paludicola SANAE]|uniref:Dihydrodipicolinate synthase n=1 Tax=Methanocella paludicola (strain DSM 17711 / JCM 13418 / NBRC 101707 / SANAE) TaxID=304371 RepID=D1YWA9_METPS|nr:dihydrodipicolinate synthase family protein [Methanocella paludicola]BAI60731.1 dihydrodipicolinate synthase [Methanocella paludicola SANAE]